MKRNKYITYILALSIVFLNRTSYASQIDNEITRISIFDNQNFLLNSEDSFDKIQNKKESLLNLIEEIKTSSNYINSGEEIKLLYDNSIIFNSRSIETRNAEWIAYSINNLNEDIDTIEKFANNDFADKKDINQDSLFFNNPAYKIPYLKLSKEEQVILDELINNSNEEIPLSISDLSYSYNENILIFFSDWLYPFMDDDDNDGVITKSKALLDSIDIDKDLFESYRNTNYDDRNKLENNSMSIDDNTSFNNLTLINLLTISSKTNILNKENSFSTDNNNKDEDLEMNNSNSSESLLVPDTVIFGENNPIPITDIDSSNVITSNIDKTNEFKTSNTENEEDYLINRSLTDSSIFSTHKKTKETYAKLSDEQKQKLNEMNTDGKYPLTIAEVKNSGLFKIPVKSTEWIYPFMIDRNNSGEVGEYDGEFDNMEPSDNTNPSPELIANDAITNDSEIIDTNVVTNSTEFINDSLITNSPQSYISTEPTTTYELVSSQNVKTGIKGLRSIVIILIIATVAYYSSKKYSLKSKNNNY